MPLSSTTSYLMKWLYTEALNLATGQKSWWYKPEYLTVLIFKGLVISYTDMISDYRLLLTNLDIQILSDGLYLKIEDRITCIFACKLTLSVHATCSRVIILKNFF